MAMSLEAWDEKVAPCLSKIRQGCFWINEEIKDILHVFKMVEIGLPEWMTEAEHQVEGTVRELRSAADRLERVKKEMAARREGKANDNNSRKLA